MRRKEYREKLAEEFARLLEEKELDWKKEWGGRDTPFNAKTGSVYKGSNRFYLSLVAAQRGYKDPRWATFRQIQAEGWRLKNAKGQGVYVEYWYPYDIKEGKNLTWQEFYKLRDGIGDRYQLRSRYFVVFNASLIDGITPYKVEKKDIPVDELVNTLSHNMDVEIRNDGGDRAYYSPSEDKIHLPIPSDFNSSYAYNSTALHELTHATGAAHRLNRNMGGIFGTQEYAFEELVAEISSCFMSSYLEIDQDEKHIENHKAYVQSWINVIREKPEALSQAIKQAERATAYMEYKAELIPKETYNEVSRSALNIDEKLLDTPQPDAEIPEKERIYHLDGEKYAANGYKPIETVETVIDETRDGLSRLYGDNHFLQDIITIHKYEQSICRNKSIIGDLDEAQISEYARKCQAYLDFGRQVDDCLEGKTQMREALQVCMTPDIMQQTGFQALPMHMTQKHLRDCMKEKDDSQPHYHGLTIEEIKKLPEELEKPAVLAQSLSREDSVIAILGYREKDGLPVIVSVVPNGKATYHLERVDSNFITSVYGKEQIREYVQRFIENERMLYINKEKSQELALLPLRLRQDHPAPVFDTIIKRINEAVKEGQAENVKSNTKEIQPEAAPKI